MIEQLRRRHSHSPGPEPLELALETVPASTPPAAAPRAVGQLVHVIHGPLSIDVPLANMTVQEAQELLRNTLHLAPNAMALLDGNEAGLTERIAPGSVLEFVRRAGVKGSSRDVTD
jgi:hypothetical protein